MQNINQTKPDVATNKAPQTRTEATRLQVAASGVVGTRGGTDNERKTPQLRQLFRTNSF